MEHKEINEVYISVDVETSGPNPGQYSLLSIGACTIVQPRSTFYIELQPVNSAQTPQAQEIHGLDLQRLAEHGTAPVKAMTKFTAWLKTCLSPGDQPVFVAFNAPFDWMFVNYYFHRYLGRNPFGHTALDIKALYMGFTGASWSQTSMRFIAPAYLEDQQLSHHALSDAIDQAHIFEKMLLEFNKKTQTKI